MRARWFVQSWALLTLVCFAGCHGELHVRNHEAPAEEENRDLLPTESNDSGQDDGEDVPPTDDEDGTPPTDDDEELPEEDPVIDDDLDDPPEDDPIDDDPEIIDEGQSCQVWQECGPLYDDQNSGYDCVDNTCVCDATGQWSTICSQNGGYFIQQECLCVFSGEPPPTTATDGCYWSWYQGPCDADRWVDTSHYEDVCGYNANDQWECHSEWVESGYWEAGDCPSGYWQELC